MHRAYALVIATTLAGALLFPLGVSGCIPSTGSTGTGIPFNLPPSPIITFDIDRGVAPLSVGFNSDRSSDDGLIIARLWDFDDGSTSEQISPEHVFTTTGIFTVGLTLTDDAGAQTTRTVVISVTEAPIPIIDVDRTASDSAPALINFSAARSSDPDGEIVEFRWDFGDGSREFLETVSHTYSTAGTFRAELTVTDNTGVTASSNVLIQIGIRKPSIEIRVPPASVINIVVDVDSPVWVQAVFDVDSTVSRFVRAGLDGDRDQCESQSGVFDVASGAEFANLSGHNGPVNDLAISPDGASILTVSSDGSIRHHDAATAGLIGSFQGVGTIESVAFSPDGFSFAYGQSNGSIVIRELDSGDILMTLSSHTSVVNDLAYSTGGTQLLSASADRTALLWDLADGMVLRTFTHSLGINAVAISPSDPTVVATGSEDATISLWSTTSGSSSLTISGHSEAVNALVFSADGATLFSASDDNTARAWDPLSGAELATFAGHSADVISLAISGDGSTLITGSADATARVWDTATASQLRSIQPCESTISAIAISPDGMTFAAAIAANNDIQLDTNPRNGNDLNVTIPAPLRLSNVPSLGGDDVDPGQYFLWVEVDTDQSEPVRTYANAAINVVEPFTDVIDVTTPVIPLINDEATVIVSEDKARQIFDLGPLDRDDRLFLSFTTAPGFGAKFDTGERLSLMIVDTASSIYAWFQTPGFILFTRDSKLVIGHSSPNYYVITEGGKSVNIRIERESGLVGTTKQTVFVNFDGVNNLVVGGQPSANIAPLDAADFNDFFNASPDWGDTETTALKATIVQTLRNLFDDYNIEFISSDDMTDPAPPFQTMHIGGESLFLFGIADYIDPRNETTTGTGITYALTIGEFGILGLLTNTTNTIPTIGAAIGCVAAHEAGHLLGLRHTDDVADVMGPSDPSIAVTFKSALVAAREQFGGLDPIGIQDTPLLLTETVGAAP